MTASINDKADELSLEKIIKKSIKKKILKIKFEDAETEESLQNLDEIKIGTIISVDFEVELKKKTKIISKYIVVAADKIQLFSARVDEQFNEPEEYLKESSKIAKEIGDALTNAFQKRRSNL
jgi:hypothetical protein